MYKSVDKYLESSFENAMKVALLKWFLSDTD